MHHLYKVSSKGKVMTIHEDVEKLEPPDPANGDVSKGVASVGHRPAVPYKIKDRITMASSNFTSWYLP
jgi:hypothetical protein